MQDPNETTTETTTEPPTQATQHRPKKRVWCVLRLRDYTLSGLHPAGDGASDFERIKSTMILTTDREAAFQLARESGGLLCAAESLPSASHAQNLAAKIDQLASE